MERKKGGESVSLVSEAVWQRRQRGREEDRKEKTARWSSHTSYPGVTVAWWPHCSPITLRGNRTDSWTKGCGTHKV